MNTKLALTAIALFAVTLGLGMLSPAMAIKPDPNEPHKAVICHYQKAETIVNPDESVTEIPEAYVVIEVDNAGKMNGHFKNDDPHHFPVDAVTGLQNGQGDFVIDNVEDENPTPDENDSVADCVTLDEALPEPEA